MFGKFLSSVIVTALCWIPVWLYFIIRWLLDPEGFIAEFLLLGLGLYVLSGIQLFLFFLWVALLLSIWTGTSRSRLRH